MSDTTEYGICYTCKQEVAAEFGRALPHPSSETQKGLCSGTDLQVVQ